MATQPARPVRTQQERSTAMRRRLLQAAVSALHEKGYAGTTTQEVQTRTGVSRGALLHHYASRAELIVAAVDHLTRERISAVLALAHERPPDTDRTAWAVRVLWSTFDGPLFTASLELWLAARTDPPLLAALRPQERVVGQAIQEMSAELFGQPADAPPLFLAVLEVLLDAMRGAAARTVVRSPGSDRRLLAAWTVLMQRALAEAWTHPAPGPNVSQH